MNINIYGNTMTGSSGSNGDVFYISPDKKAFLLADGASGAGVEGKQLMGKTCIDSIKNFDYVNSGLVASDYIDKLIWKINNELIDISQRYRKSIYGTIIIGIYDDGVLTITSIGDSPAFYYNGKETKRIAKNKKRYESMIDGGYITREEYNGYIDNMHFMMKSCFDIFIPSIVPNNIIEVYNINPNDILVLCCDGISDWISKEEIIECIIEEGLESGIEKLILESKEIAIKRQDYYDDLTGIAIKWIE